MIKKVVTTLLCASIVGCSSGPPRPDKYAWELIASPGIVQMVYVSPEALKDKDFLAELLRYLVNKNEISEVMFFDSKAHTPLRFPMTDAQMLHWRATYNFNPNTNFERFVFVEVTNSQTSPPQIQEIESDIRP